MSKTKLQSKTINAAVLIGIMGIVETNFGLLRESLGDWYGVSYIAIAALMYYLRTVTTGPVK